jgi:hypothetical protein
MGCIAAKARKSSAAVDPWLTAVDLEAKAPVDQPAPTTIAIIAAHKQKDIALV